VGEKGQSEIPSRGGWKRRALIALAIFGALVLIFHRPLLQGLVRLAALHYSAKENLKMDFRLEGNVLTSLTVRNLHVVPTGPADIESIGVDFVHADYSLFSFVRHGLTDFFRNVEVRSARIVLDPSKTEGKDQRSKTGERMTLWPIFPERVRLSGIDLVVRNRPRDLVVEQVDLDLNPRRPGELRVGKLQLPTGQEWSKLSAQTSCANRNLIVRDLALNNDERVRSLNIDASHINAKKLAMSFDSEIGGGKISGSTVLSETRSSLNTEFHLNAENVAADALNKYFGWPDGFVRAEIARVKVDGTGLLNSPRTWNATVTAQVNDFHGQGIVFDRGDFQIVARDGSATLQTGDLTQGQNQFHLRGSAELPADIKQFGSSVATLELTSSAIDLQALTAESPEPVSGMAQINGKMEIKDGKLETNLIGSAEAITFHDGNVAKLNVNLKATKIMAPAGSRPGSLIPATAAPWFAGLRSEVTLNGSDIRFRDYVLDSVEGSASSVGDLVRIDRLTARRKQNELNVRGRYRVPEDLSKFPEKPEQIEIALNAPELGDYWATDSPDKVFGPLQIDGQVEWKKGIGNGQLSIFGSNVRMRDLVFKQLSAQCSISGNVVYVNDLTASLNEHDLVGGNGMADLSAPFHYSGKVAANVANLSTLQPLLHASGNENKLEGMLAINWEGSGEAGTFKNSGQLKMVLEKGRYGELKSLQSNVDANYSADGLDVPIMFLRSDKMNFQASARAKGETLEISNIQLDQEKFKYAAGYISIPFIWKHLGTNQPVCPPNGKVVATFESENIDIKKLFQDVGAKPVASGVLNVKLNASGTIADLNARLDVQLRDVRSENLPKFEPAAFELIAVSQHDRLSVTGKLQQSKIQPLELSADLPFDIPKIARERKIPDDTPLTAKVRLPRSSVNFVRQFVPDIQQLDGDLALDVDVTGTIGQPVLSGAGDITINVARFENATLPTLRDFKARINFAQNAFTLERFGGELAGGHFTLAGRVSFPRLITPMLDLQLKAESVLVARNDDLTARADADVKVSGPFTSATVTGTVALTNSQFLKNLDLIPIGLPGRPAPQPVSRPEISFPRPPLRDWKFDLALKTKDPVLIRGNLANGGATSDLHLTGTGLHPGLQGVVRLEKVEATLPFSRLEVAYGFLYFDPSDSFNPRIELQGTSLIRDYIIHVYVYGTSLSPEAVFTSEPPLPQEEIISLLATGTTREELTSGTNVVMGRAGMLLVQQLYRKIFKKGQATQSNSIFDRLDMDFGTVDPRTGQQQGTARLKLNDQFVVIGDLGVGGDYRGMLKYLLRFR
jgi:hypothetical protein